jgi:uncharacterized membrane protein (DUF485 family)
VLEVELRRKRPAIIWLTQVLLVFYVGIISLALVTTLLAALPSISSTLRSVLATLVGLLMSLVLAGPAAVLFYGLARRRTWAWRGSIAFMACFVLLMVISQLVRPKGPLPEIEIAPNERFGAHLAQITIPILLGLYVFRLYFSPKMRAFLGIAQRVQDGR